MKNVVITGPTGAVGMALIEYMVSQGVRVVAVLRPDSERRRQMDKLLDSGLVDLVYCNLDQLDQLPDIVMQAVGKPVDAFYHLAWAGTSGASRNDVYMQNLNVKYALDSVVAAHKMGCRVWLGAGSQAEYGRFEGMLKSDTPANPENGYGMAKLCAGQMTRLLCEQLGIGHVWTRILSVYGPYDGENTLIMSVIKKLLQGESPECTKAEQMWDYIYSKDAAKALYLLGKCGAHGITLGKVYCVGSGRVQPLKMYTECIRDVIYSHELQQVNPVEKKVDINYGALPYAEKQVMYLQADVSDLCRDVGFEPEYTFEQGIKETYFWYVNYRK